ncbi:MAG: GNAT family N-acetyltransferase [Propionibacteriaceae bacterium]
MISAPPPDLVRLGADCDQELVGYVDLKGTAPGRRELGYTIGGRDRWGLGLGTAAAAAGLTYGFTALCLDEIWAGALDANTPSVRILRRVGMRETGRGDRRSFLDRATYYRQFVITATEWIADGTERSGFTISVDADQQISG